MEHFREYLEGGGKIDLEDILALFSEDREKALKCFIDHSRAAVKDICLDMESVRRRLTDKEACKLICRLCKIRNPLELQRFEPGARDKCIALLKENELSIRQISRLTGISFGIVRK